MNLKPLRNLVRFGCCDSSEIERGRRTIEVLKQPLHKPLPVEKQVVILYALTHGFLDISIPFYFILKKKIVGLFLRTL